MHKAVKEMVSAVSMRDVVFTYENSTESSVSVPMVFNLEIPQGMKIAIVGPSGAGKSTLLKLISGENIAGGGSISVMDRDLNPLNLENLSRFRLDEISQVFQELELLPQLSALENASLQLELRGEKKRLARARASEVLDHLGLESKLRKKPNQLSGGERQRVAIARAITARSSLYLADEPTAALDKETKKKAIDLLFEENEGATFIFSTHDDYLMNRCDRIVDITTIITREQL